MVESPIEKSKSVFSANLTPASIIAGVISILSSVDAGLSRGSFVADPIVVRQPYNPQNFRAEIDALAQAQEDVVLNLSRVSFVDSCGIATLVALHRKLLARGYRLKVLGLRGQPLQLFINLELVPLFCGDGNQSLSLTANAPNNSYNMQQP